MSSVLYYWLILIKQTNNPDVELCTLYCSVLDTGVHRPRGFRVTVVVRQFVRLILHVGNRLMTPLFDL